MSMWSAMSIAVSGLTPGPIEMTPAPVDVSSLARVSRSTPAARSSSHQRKPPSYSSAVRTRFSNCSLLVASRILVIGKRSLS